MKCNFCNGSGEEYDIKSLRVVECSKCDGCGIIHSRFKEYIKPKQKKNSKRVPKFGRDYSFEDE